MYQGNWKCSSCGGAITELPFQPRSESGLTCRSCFMKSRNGGSSAPSQPEPDMTVADEAPPIPEDAGIAGEQPAPPDDLDGATPSTPGERPKFEGSWTCGTCGGEITSLPFEPRGNANLKCLDCFKASKA